MSDSTANPGPTPAVLDGIRVLDFGRYIAGPFCAALLGDLGAEVIRVERVGGGEDRYVTPVTSDGEGALFLQCNRNKRGLTLDTSHPEGREIQERLVRTADVVIANLPPRTLPRMGLDYPRLRELKPDIILTTVSAFGSHGPWRDKIGFDGLAQAISGNLHLTGAADVPTRSATPYVDYGTGSLAAVSTLAALMHRHATGEGQHVDGALLRTAVTFMNGPLLEQSQRRLDREATLNRNPIAGPADVFRTRDGWVMCLVVGRFQFERWCELVGAGDLLDDERFRDDIGRGDHGEVLSDRMASWCATRTTGEALAAMEAAKVPGGPVHTPQDALDDPQVRASGILQPVAYPGTDHDPLISAFPFELSASPATVRSRAPTVGEHTGEILHELGYAADAVERLRVRGVV